jgi:lipoprotein-anchoring transpeptidase ErfK/SrfK
MAGCLRDHPAVGVHDEEQAMSRFDMSMNYKGIPLLRAAAIAIASTLLPGAASAQLFFDWGGGSQKVNDSGRQSVRINADAKPGEIIVSFSDRKLYLITAPGQALSYPVAIPREQDRWEGKTSVTQKRENPSWTPTPSMLKENPKLPRWVPGGHPMNPLGNRALYLGSSYYRIHGTDAPWTIGTAVSKGCIRMYNKDALDVYERTKVGAKVLVTWKNYQASPESEAAQTAAREEAPAGQRSTSSASRTTERETATETAAPAAAAPAPAAKQQRTAQSGSRYSDIFGTPEPAAPSSASRPSGDAQSAPANAQQGRTARPPRKSREAAGENAGTGDAQPAAQPARAKATEQKQRPTPVETGSLPERRPRAKAAPPAAPASEPAQAAVPAQPDVATRAMEAAERAAAAAERAAAAAERAERAVAARAAASAVAAPAAAQAAPAQIPAQVPSQAATPAATPAAAPAAATAPVAPTRPDSD